jgi:hypothetical protein
LTKNHQASDCFSEETPRSVAGVYLMIRRDESLIDLD